MFHQLISQWFSQRFGEPTDPQRLAWPEIAAGRHTLVAAPTGSGKTLAAFLWCIDRLMTEALAGELADGVQVVYVSPLKALSNDIRRNLETPLAELRACAAGQGLDLPPLRALVRTGDTPAAERQAMLRKPPHILVTTPESLYLLLTSAKSREILRSVRTVIVDEIHALARDKRGTHFALTLERLEHLCSHPLQRIGLSATQAPIDEIARFLVGSRAVDAAGQPDCAIIDAGHIRTLDLNLEVPATELSAVCSQETWAEIYGRLTELINAHRSTLIFVNTRRLAERVAHHLSETLGAAAVASHHGSLSRESRLDAEERLKAGELKVIVATASLEMGIDIGFIDLVCQIGSPRSIATLLQRVGRSGHSLGVVPKGRLFPLTRDELLECLALVRAVRRGQLDQIIVPALSLDILAQQIVAMAACEDWSEDDLYEISRRAWPYRNLTRTDFDIVINMVSEGVVPARRIGAYLHRDAIAGRVRARRGARIAAITSGGVIPELADFRVVLEEDGTFIGTLNEDFAIESLAGDVFLLGNSSWMIRYVRGGQVVVRNADGVPATIPFWLGEAPARTDELSAGLSRLREEIADQLPSLGAHWAGTGEGRVSSQSQVLSPSLEGRGQGRVMPHAQNETIAPATTNNTADPDPDSLPTEIDLAPAIAWLRHQCGVDEYPAWQAAQYVAAQKAAIGVIPTQQQIVFERFFDESGGMQLVIHAPLGARVNRAWGLALRKRFCRSFDFELQATADDNGVVLSIGPQHSFPIEAMFKMLTTANGEELLKQAMIAAPVFQTRWRWAATRALAVLRQSGGKKVPPALQRFRSDDLLAAVFPSQAGCLENHHGDIEIPDHPLVRQAVDDCLHEAMDVDGWIGVLGKIQTGEIKLVARDTREPSPFSYQLVNANPYTFLDDAPLEERRARAVSTRRTLAIDSVRDLGRLDPEAIAQVKSEAWPLVRDADELHDTLLAMTLLRADEAPEWGRHFDALVSAGRAGLAVRRGQPELWIAAERWPLVRAIFPDAGMLPVIKLPESLDAPWELAAAMVALIRGRLQVSGPITSDCLAEQLGIPAERIDAAFEALEGEGTLMRGRFTPAAYTTDRDGTPTGQIVEWCERRLLARIHRLTLDGLRRQIKPVDPVDYIRFLTEWQHATGETRRGGRAELRNTLSQLQGFEIAAGLWEGRVLPARVRDYDPRWLDELSMSGDLAWGRLCPTRKDPEDGPSKAVITRAVPISLVLRENLGWLAPGERQRDQEPRLRSGAQLVREALTTRGALFHHELQALTGLLPTQVDDALHELATLGLVTADVFTAVRALAKHKRGRERGMGVSPMSASSYSNGSPSNGHSRSKTPTGRWSLFPGFLVEPRDEEKLLNWARLLLDRWGVLFRDLLARETASPPWGQLVTVLRRLEARGEIRGGRFVAGVGGEQYATAAAVELMRQIRDKPATGEVIILSAADPLNLAGVITREQRIAATHTNSIALRDGRLVAANEMRQVQLFADFPPVESQNLSRRLRRNEHVAVEA